MSFMPIRDPHVAVVAQETTQREEIGGMHHFFLPDEAWKKGLGHNERENKNKLMAMASVSCSGASHFHPPKASSPLFLSKQRTSAPPLPGEVEAHARPKQQTRRGTMSYALYCLVALFYVVVASMVRTKPFARAKRRYVPAAFAAVRAPVALCRALVNHKQGERPAAGGTWPCQHWDGSQTACVLFPVRI